MELQTLIPILEKYGWLGVIIIVIAGIALKTEWTLVIRHKNKT